ncbi:OmpA family protein (plasmid) [Phyllobacterium sp. 628]|uniref:OmpA family protein n=1 Tax=Phyllobacterium sp. 628 TaxID=2718938 RepID=UPI00166236A2|nr:OmpA family protein [Phyllobacterium sp. 628]QND55160.1 OmpA family protein [Phyllobacterium sp. 628]
MRQLFSLSAAILIGVASPAIAGPAYKSEDIVKHFVNTADLGKSRAICVGTDQECAKKAVNPAASPLNMKVTFELNSDRLTEEAKQTLGEFAKALNDQRLQVATFQVEGHTDATGTDLYNDTLSMRRAQSVSAYLSQLGVSPERLKAEGFGKRHPSVNDPFAPENRRVETRLVLPQG